MAKIESRTVNTRWFEHRYMFDTDRRVQMTMNSLKAKNYHFSLRKLRLTIKAFIAKIKY